jgi:hypothetical protein
VKVTKAITRLVWSPASENSVGIYRRRQANHIDSCLAPLSAINDKTAATGAKPRPIKSIIMSVGFAASSRQPDFCHR